MSTRYLILQNSKLAEGTAVVAFPFRKNAFGAGRLQALDEITGNSELSDGLCRKAGKYLLDDSVLGKLSERLRTPNEFSYFSCDTWKRQANTDAECDSFAEPLGILVSPEEFSLLTKILRGRNLGIWELIEVYEHLYFHQLRELNLLVPTRVRV